jgi:hypothetical protein
VTDRITPAMVRDLLKKHWPNGRQLPDLANQCYSIAVALQGLDARRPPPAPTEPEGVTHAKRFLEETPAWHEQAQREHSMYSYIRIDPDMTSRLVVVDQRRHDLSAIALDRLERARAAMQEALDAWGGRDLLYIEDMDPAKVVAAWAQSAWESTGEDVPRSVNENDPLCGFVADALALTCIRVGQGKTRGEPYTAAAISAVLRGRVERLRFIRVTEDDT